MQCRHFDTYTYIHLMNSERINKYACSQVRCQTLFIPSDRWLSERVSTRVTSYRISPRYGSKAQMIVPFDDDEGDVQTTCVISLAYTPVRALPAVCTRHVLVSGHIFNTHRENSTSNWTRASNCASLLIETTRYATCRVLYVTHVVGRETMSLLTT